MSIVNMGKVMKKIMFAVFLIVVGVFGLKAEVYEMFIKKGLTWKEYGRSTDRSPSHPMFYTSLETNYLENEVEYDGETRIELYTENQGSCCEDCYKNRRLEKTLEGYMKTEGDKVFYHSLGDEAGKWHLLYDFGLKVGEGGVFGEDPGINGYVRCEEIYEIENERKWEGMALAEWMELPGFDESESRWDHGDGTWIRGLGSTSGMLYPYFFGIAGGSSRLIEATYNGEIIYKDYPTGVNLVSADDDDFTVEVCGGRLTVRGITGCAGIYSIDGHLVKTAEANEAVELPGGLYIIKSGERSRKVIL